MRRVVFAAALTGSVVGLALVAGTGRASLYSPEEPYAIPVGADGKPTPLRSEVFRGRLTSLTNALIEPKKSSAPSDLGFFAGLAHALTEPKDNSDREQFLKRIAERGEAKKLRAPEAAALAADLLRVGQSDKALAVLGPLTSTNRPDYFVFATLGHVHAARGEWADALRYHQDGQLDTKMPAEVKGLTKQQRDWWEKLDAGYVPHFYRIRRDEAAALLTMTPVERNKAVETEEPLPLFPLPGEGESRPPVRFVNEKGEYQPGVIAASEKAKLPPDAIATVQQLLLWTPTDTRLLWLLGELYAANGDLEAALKILDTCTWGRQYGNRKVLAAHRHAVMEAAKARPTPTAPEDVPLVQPTTPATDPTPNGGDDAKKPPISMQTVLIYFGVVGVIAVFALVRALTRRGKNGGTVG